MLCYDLDLNVLLHQGNPAGNSNHGNWNWSLDRDGLYSVSSLRKALDSRCLVSVPTVTAWCKVVPIKVNIFIWRLRLCRLPTRENLARRGVSLQSLICPLCNSDMENEEHLFLKCSLAKEIMAHLHVRWPALPDLVGVNSIEDLIVGSENASFSPFQVVKFESVIRAFLWVIWSYRNDRCFNGKVKNIHLLVADIMYFSFFWVSCRGKGFGTLTWESWL